MLQIELKQIDQPFVLYEKARRNKNLQLCCQCFFPFPQFAHKEQTVFRKFGFLCILFCGVRPQFRNQRGDLEPYGGPFLISVFQILIDKFLFQEQKETIFFDKTKVVLKLRQFFPSKTGGCAMWLNWKVWSQTFPKNWEFCLSCCKTEKKINVYKSSKKFN